MKEEREESLFSQDCGLPEEKEDIDIRKIGILHFHRGFYYIIGPEYYVSPHPEKSHQKKHRHKGNREKEMLRLQSENKISEVKYVIDHRSMKESLFLQAAEMMRQHIPCKAYYNISYVSGRGIRYVRIVKIHPDSYENYWENSPNGKLLEQMAQDEGFIATTLAYIAEKLKQTTEDPSDEQKTETEKGLSKWHKSDKSFAPPPHPKYTTWNRKKSRKHRKIHHALRRRSQN
jgi:hypothetical protein